jgi:RimJ/RimL family protein N-acetyltransferase
MPTDIAPLPETLALYEQVPLGTLAGKDGTPFAFVVGLDRALVDDLRAKSLDESDVALQQFTSDHARFGEGSYEKWYAKGRTPFALVAPSGALAACAFFGPKALGEKSLKHLSEAERALPVPDAGEWHTLAFRSYAPFRGQGLMKPFVRAATAAYLARHPQARLWVAIQSDNVASRGLAEALGFVEDAAHSVPAEHHLVMVYEPSRA